MTHARNRYRTLALHPSPYPMNSNQPRNARLPSVDGSYTILEAFDFHRKHNPHEPVYVFSANEASEPTEVTFEVFGRASDRMAEFIRPRQSVHPDGRVVGMILPVDLILYQATLIGIMKAGYVVSL